MHTIPPHTISQCSCGKRICKNYYDLLGKIWNDALKKSNSGRMGSFCVRHTDEIILKDWKYQIRFDEHLELLIHMDESSDDEEILTRDGD
ncbi:hypothetical protein NQ315_014493 [Exocentrus adspersus]|uniref:Post-SET domain-containing protein n=1 Tax=Exocentrus adspersus TaxID=1586481 RepID=A0AAV8V6U0_9CUCU|nr:hypothetical protein NQ315_014493 [Exocentrus adspersus]